MTATVRLDRGSVALVAFAALLLSALPAKLGYADVSSPSSDGPVEVRMVVFVLDVDSINSANYSFEANVYIEARWTDQRLAHDGAGERAHALTDVWHPRIQFANQQLVWRTFPEIVEVSPGGEVVYRQRVWGNFSQSLDLRDFPFDEQTFKIHLGSAGYSPKEVLLVKDQALASGIAEKLSVADWDVLDWSAAPAAISPIPGQRPPRYIPFNSGPGARSAFISSRSSCRWSWLWRCRGWCSGSIPRRPALRSAFL